MSYKTRAELQAYMIQDGENWILHNLHNRPHDEISDNCDELRTREANLAGKLGLSPAQKKLDGFPVWYNTYFVRTGMTFVQALSTLDYEIKLLEDMYRIILFNTAARGTLDWEVTKSDKAIPVHTDTAASPGSISLANFGSFLWILYPGQSKNGVILVTEDIQAGWALSSKTLASIYGTAFSLEEHGNSILYSYDAYGARMITAAFNETGTEGYTYYLKSSEGTVGYDSKSITFASEGTADPASQIIKNDLTKFVRSISAVNNQSTAYIFVDVTSDTRESYVLPRESRLFDVDESIVLVWPNTDASYTVSSTSTTIEGIDGAAIIQHYSHKEIREIEDGAFGMVLADEFGNLVFRESTDLFNWDAVVAASNDGVILDAVSGFDFDYPTFLPVGSGYICFYNTNYNNGTLDDIHYAISRDNGLTWEVPSQYLDIVGVFPKLVRTRNGSIYLYFWTTTGISFYRLFITTEQVATAGGA
jgi:hypothetical protein